MNRVNKKKKKMHPLRTIFFLIIIFVCIYLGYEYKTYGNFNHVVQVFSKINLTKINLEDASYSSNNLVQGQTLKVIRMDILQLLQH